MSNFLYLGNFSLIDSDNLSFEQVDDDSLEGVEISSGMSFVDVTYNRNNAPTNAQNGALGGDRFGINGFGGPTDTTLGFGGEITTNNGVSYDLGAGSLETGFSVTLQGRASVEWFDLDTNAVRTQTIDVVYLQMKNGDLFVRPGTGMFRAGQTLFSIDPDSEQSYDNTAVANNEVIQSFTITSFDTTLYVSGDTEIPQEWVSGSAVLCFTKGTMIATPEGDRKIENLAIGDLVMTKDNGAKPLVWVGSMKASAEGLKENARLRPVRIMAGSLGQGMPEQDLVVSRQHRVLVSSDLAKKVFDVDEVLIPAIKLTELPGIYVDETVDEVEYVHFLFDRHEVVFANGAPSESLFTGPEALKAVSPDAREEILLLFPELQDVDFRPKAAALIPQKGREIKQLVSEMKATHALQ